MRTTTSMIYRNAIYNINKTNSDLLKINQQISSGKQMSTISDNPVNLVSALGMRSDLSAIEQYQKNLDYGVSMVTAAETALTQMKDLTMQANTLALQANNDSLSLTDRQNMAVEINNLYEQAISLANTKIGGKYIFGGYRTSGYTEAEPAPFIDGLADGYTINGNTFVPLDSWLSGTPMQNTSDINSGDLIINGVDIGAIDLDSPALTLNGVNMGGADNVANAINAGTSGVSANLTTLYHSGTTASAGSATTVDFNLNGVAINFTTSTSPADDAVAAINAISEQTGVTAVVGDGSNGGGISEVVLMNSRAGDESHIVVSGYTETGGTASTGLTNIDQAVGPTSNTGQISLSTSQSFTITSNNFTDDTVLDLLGLGGGGVGFSDESGDGQLIYGYQLAGNDLQINGINIGAAQADSYSTVLADTSAAAKADAINAVSDQTGVTALVTTARTQTSAPVEAGVMDSGDLVINGVDIFTSATDIMEEDTDNVLLDAINSQSELTGVFATRNSSGQLLLSAVDGRNVQLETSANGESISHLNGGSPAAPQSTIYFGSISLSSENAYTLTTTPTTPSNFEPGLAALGLNGGVTRTNETGDVDGDGSLSVLSIASEEGNVRYAGDAENNLEIMIGTKSTLEIAKNGQEAVIDTGIFDTLKTLEDNLLGINFTTVSAIHQAQDIYSPLADGSTGLEKEDEAFADGSFTVTVTDHAYHPPRDFAMTIPVDSNQDTLSSVSDKLNGVPGLASYWNAEGQLQVDSSDPARYSFSLSNDSSNFLQMTGITFDTMQSQALDQSIADTEETMESLTEQISDFGGIYNRLEVQGQIYDELELSVRSNLSIKEDTDIVEAIMQLEAKTTAYEAALSAAAKVMDLSLLDFL